MSAKVIRFPAHRIVRRDATMQRYRELMAQTLASLMADSEPTAPHKPKKPRRK
jgi:hypothetical protein